MGPTGFEPATNRCLHLIAKWLETPGFGMPQWLKSLPLCQTELRAHRIYLCGTWPYQSRIRLNCFLCQLYLRIREVAPYPQAEQRFFTRWYECLPQRLHGRCIAF